MLQEFKSRRITPRELIQLALGIYKQCFKYIFIIGLGIYIPTSVVLMMAPMPDMTAIYTTGDASSAYGYLFVSLALIVAVLPLETAAITYFTRQKLDNAECSLEGALDASLGNWWKLFASALIYVGLVGLCSFLLIPAIIFGISFCFYSNIVVVEGLSGFAALQRSAQIVKRRWWRTLGTLLAIGIIEFFLQNLASLAIEVLFAAVFDMQNIVLAIVLNIAGSLAVNILGVVFRIITALYFFNLYYTAERPATEVPLQ